jgi:kynureninase
MGGNYRITIVAKNATKGARLGLRVQEVYPNRFDVVYDLKNHSVVGTFRESEVVKNEAIKIEKLGKKLV